MELPETDSEDELPPGWEERCTLEGEVFYAHHHTKTTQWNHPRTGKKKKVTGALPLGWSQSTDSNNKVLFTHSDSGRSTFTDPRLAFAVEQTNCIKDLRQRYDGCSSGLHILHGMDLSGFVAIVTGASSGIGFETAKCLAFQGCTVVLACRDMEKGQEMINRILRQRPFATLHLLHIDLSSLRSVKSFAREVVHLFSIIDMLILNAGIFNAPHKLTEDGLEQTFQVNHLSHFYLMELLKPTLKSGSRVVWLSSESHRFASIESPDDITRSVLSPSRSQFTSIIAYNNSKLCNVLAAFEMHRRYSHLGINFYAVHPGNLVCSSLNRNSWLYWLIFNVVRPWSKTMAQACASTLYSACSQDLCNCSGLYINNCLPCTPSPPSVDEIIAHRLYGLNFTLIEKVLGNSAFTI